MPAKCRSVACRMHGSSRCATAIAVSTMRRSGVRAHERAKLTSGVAAGEVPVDVQEILAHQLGDDLIQGLVSTRLRKLEGTHDRIRRLSGVEMHLREKPFSSRASGPGGPETPRPRYPIIATGEAATGRRGEPRPARPKRDRAATERHIKETDRPG